MPGLPVPLQRRPRQILLRLPADPSVIGEPVGVSIEFDGWQP